MTTDGTSRPPAPVLAVVALTGLLAVALVVTAVAVALVKGDAVGLLFALPALLPGAAALGLWQGNRGARVVGVMIGLAGFVSVRGPGAYTVVPAVLGLAVILLLLVPPSSRAWFGPAGRARHTER